MSRGITGAPPEYTARICGNVPPQRSRRSTSRSSNAGDATIVVARYVAISRSSRPASTAPGRASRTAGMRLVRPAARLARSTTGIVATSTSSSLSGSDSSNAPSCARMVPCVRSNAFGRPVLPLVNVKSAGSSAATNACAAASGPEDSGSRSLIRAARASCRENVSANRFPSPAENATVPKRFGIARMPATVMPQTKPIGVATTASGRRIRQHASTYARPARGLTTTATAPIRRIAPSTAYRSMLMGTSTRTWLPLSSPAARRRPATRSVCASNAANVRAASRPRRASKIATRSGTRRMLSASNSATFAFSLDLASSGSSAISRAITSAPSRTPRNAEKRLRRIAPECGGTRSARE